MTERAVALLKDDATHERMRRAAAARALEFSAERVVPRYEGLIRTCWVIDVLRLVRAHNLVVAAAGVLAGGWIALGVLATPKLLLFAAVAAVGLGAAGNAANDIWDADADRVNRRPDERPLAAGHLSRGTADLCVVGGILLGVGAAALVGGGAVLVGLAALGVMLV